MTIHLPTEVETSIEAVVQSGRFSTVDDAMTDAARLLLRTITHEQPRPQPPLLGSMRDAVDDRDEIVREAMKRRRERAWQTILVA